MTSEREFVDSAVALLCGLSGTDPSELGPDTDLRSTGWFDSLLLVSFLDFIETQRGAPLPISAETGIPIADLATIRGAYRLVVAPA
jgi:hypothetical protein